MTKKRTTKRPTPKNKKKTPSPKRRVQVKTHSRPSKAVRRAPQNDKRKDANIAISQALGLMRRRGLSLTRAAKTAGASQTTVHRAAGSALKKQPNDRYAVRRRDRVVRVVHVLTDDGIEVAALKRSEQASLVAEHWNAVQAYVSRGESTALNRFDGLHVTDVDGNVLVLSTDRIVIERLANAGVLSFETIYVGTR